MEDQNGGPASDQRTLFLVNIFIIHTIRFLNKFSAVCEQKLAEVHRRILRLDATLALLEAKLRSIDGLEGIVEPSALEALPDLAIPMTEKVPEEETGLLISSSGAAPTSSTSTTAAEQSMDEFSSARTVQQPLSTVKDDPRFSRFFRMLRVGVPEKAVKMQMSIEGYDSSLLDTPDAGLPAM